MTDFGAKCYQRYLQGDSSALDDLVREYGDPLVRFANTFLQDLALSEDVMEDTFASLIVRRKPFREEAKFKTYLFRIARNRCIDLLRSQKRVVYFDEVRSTQTENPEQKAMEGMENEDLYRSLFSLPDEQRKAVELVYLEEFSISETAKILNKSRKQIYNLLARAKGKLKEILEKAGVYHENE